MLRLASKSDAAIIDCCRGEHMAEKWQLTGQVLVSCNCDWGCPCNFNARPTTGKCEGGWTWHIERGRTAM